MTSIICIVEGDGEVSALPLLLRRLIPSLDIQRPLNAKGRFKIQREGELERFLELTRARPCDGVLILLDADEDCSAELAWQMSARASKLHLPFPVVIVYAKCEFEAWFLASLETLAGSYGIPATTTFPEDRVESTRGAKEWLRMQMPLTRGYSETRDQPAFASRIDLDLVRRRSRSFRRLEHALEEVLAGGAIVTPRPAKK